MNNNPKITFWGGVGSVTGANFLVDTGKSRFLVDCGLLQGVSGAEDENAKGFPYDPKSIDFLFITHAHMDHIGRVPKLVRDGFEGIIYSTEETKEIASLMFADALKVMEVKKKENDFKPLYSLKDVERAISLWKSIPYHKDMSIADFKVNLLDAGHILGSSMYQFYIKNKKIVFTGDSGNSPTPLLKDTEKLIEVDYLIMDSVYGDRNHESKQERDEKFKRIVKESISRGGTLIIPAFSIERTQVILYELNNLVEDGFVRSVPVFLDSPLGEKVTAIYKRSTNFFNDGVKKEIKSGDNIFSFPKLEIIHGALESKDIIKQPSPKIIIAGSGMSEGGRVIHHEINFLPDPNSTILLMGYQAVGTLGRQIQDGNKEVMINDRKVYIKARVEMISGYSSHKDSDHLVEMVSDSADTVKKVFVVMGEPKSSLFLVQKLRDNLDVNAIYPERGLEYNLD
jgi:metallo-beta-lactamase family protein